MATALRTTKQKQQYVQLAKNNFEHAAHFFVHFFAVVAARRRRESF